MTALEIELTEQNRLLRQENALLRQKIDLLIRRVFGASSEKLDPLIRELGDFDEQDVDLVEFLRALSDDSFDRKIPERVPSGLPVGGRIQ